MEPTPDGRNGRSPLERLLGAFTEVRAGEAGTALLMLLNLFLLLVGYYILKTVREPLILATGGAEVKAYASAGQAATLMFFVPLYGWFSSRVERSRLVTGVTLFFLVNVEMFYLGALAGVPYLGVVFFIWVGIFSLSTIAQFWSYANDIYRREAGDRLFPLIAIGATAGSPFGAKAASLLFDAGIDAYSMLHVTALILLVHLVLYRIINARTEREAAAAPRSALAPGGGFELVFRSRYLLLIAGLLIVLNVVNTTGEYILSSSVVEHANAHLAADPKFDKGAFIGSFYGNYFFWVNTLAVVLQAFVASRLVRWFGIAGVLFALPVVALGAYGFVAAGAGFTALRLAKTAENATDYSIMNTARHLLWLPTSREEKYKAKQALDTFFVRTGDLISAGLVWLGTQQCGFGIRGFALGNLVMVGGWLVLAGLVVRENRSLTVRHEAQSARS